MGPDYVEECERHLMQQTEHPRVEGVEEAKNSLRGLRYLTDRTDVHHPSSPFSSSSASSSLTCTTSFSILDGQREKDKELGGSLFPSFGVLGRMRRFSFFRSSSFSLPSFDANVSLEEQIQELKLRQKKERRALSLLSSPLKCLKYFLLSLFHHCGCFCHVIFNDRILLSLVVALFWMASLFLVMEKPPESFAHEFVCYVSFCSWWILLGVLSSIGLGSGLHTFMLYLSPHVARFTLKATSCGRIDLKKKMYDTPQWNMDLDFLFPSPRSPLSMVENATSTAAAFGGAGAGSSALVSSYNGDWVFRNCEFFGKPNFPHVPSAHAGGYFKISTFRIFLCLCAEIVLWGVGSAVGELPPYLVARAARFSGERVEELAELLEDGGEERDGDRGGEREMERIRETMGEPVTKRRKWRFSLPFRSFSRDHPSASPSLSSLAPSPLVSSIPVSPSPASSSKSLVFRLYRKFLLRKAEKHLMNPLVIFVLAAIPNPLFDLAGLLCGHFLVPLKTFFLPTLLGKALVKATTQSLFVILLFDAHSMDVMENWLEGAIERMRRRQGCAPSPSFSSPFSPSSLSGPSSSPDCSSSLFQSLANRVLTLVDVARERIAHGAVSPSLSSPSLSSAASSSPPSSPSSSIHFSPFPSLRLLWTSFMLLTLLSFLLSAINTMARSFLSVLHQREVHGFESRFAESAKKVKHSATAQNYQQQHQWLPSRSKPQQEERGQRQSDVAQLLLGSVEVRGVERDRESHGNGNDPIITSPAFEEVLKNIDHSRRQALQLNPEESSASSLISLP